MTRRRSSFPQGNGIAFFCILGSIWLFSTFPNVFFWLLGAILTLVVVLLILMVLLSFIPPFVFRHAGHIVGYVKRAFERHRYQPVRNEYEFEQSYEQGYQAHTLPAGQESLAPYELPQAQYPQQQQPPM